MNKTVIYSLVAALFVGLFISTFSYAQGPFQEKLGLRQTTGAPGYETMLQNKADALGVTVENLKEDLMEGKRLCDIAEEQGISRDDLHERMLEVKTERLNQLVEEGVMTKEQADQRISLMEERHESGLNGTPQGARMWMRVAK